MRQVVVRFSAGTRAGVARVLRPIDPSRQSERAKTARAAAFPCARRAKDAFCRLSIPCPLNLWRPYSTIRCPRRSPIVRSSSTSASRSLTRQTVEREPEDRPCDHIGCQRAGLHRAPKSREHANQFWHFCTAHAADYNKRWDYFQGMIGRRTRRLPEARRDRPSPDLDLP